MTLPRLTPEAHPGETDPRPGLMVDRVGGHSAEWAKTLRARVPSGERTYFPGVNLWWVAERHADALRRTCIDFYEGYEEELDDGSILAATKQAVTTQPRLI